jgi:hypothetical protein
MSQFPELPPICDRQITRITRLTATTEYPATVVSNAGYFLDILAEVNLRLDENIMLHNGRDIA